MNDYLAWGLMTPDRVTMATEEYIKECDSVGQWIEAHIRPGTIMQNVPASKMHQSYSEWAETEGAQMLSAKALGSKLKQHGLQQFRTRDGVFYSQIEIV